MQSISIVSARVIFPFIILLILTSQKNLFAIELDTLKQNEKVVVDSIKITGNNKTEDFIILRELNFQVGDSVSQKLLHYNRERIFSLGLFNRVEILVESQNTIHNIVIIVDETWYIYPIPFWYVEKSSLSNSTVGVNLTWKNFRGRNEMLRSSIGIGYDSFVSFQYENPALFYDSEIGFNLNFGYYKTSNRTEEAKIINGGDFNYKIVKGSIGFYKRLNLYNLFGVSVGLENWQVDITPTKKITVSGTSVDNTPWISAYYVFDSRDLKQFSNNGLLVSGDIFQKGLGANGISYNIADIDLRVYKSMIGELTSKLRFKYRLAFGGAIPYYDYSFLGYSDRIRGHSNDYVEGENSILTSMELSYPLLSEWNVSLNIPLVPKSLTSARLAVYVQAFADAGTAFNKGDALYVNKFNSGYGLGLTILILPFNAIRFEYAINELGNGEVLIATGFSF